MTVTEENMEVVWEDPPASTWAPHAGRHAAFFDVLKANPGRWAVAPLRDGASTAAARGKYVGQAGYSWEACQRQHIDEAGERTIRVYVRCMGPAEPDAS